MKISILRLTLAALSILLAVPATAQVKRPAKPIIGLDVKPFVPRFARLEQRAEMVSMANCDKPVYPRASLRNEETGNVILRFRIAANGAIMDNVIERSSGFRDLDKSALTGFLSCKFRPATIDGRAVQGYALLSFIFTLD